ncbi:MAG: PorV/PorQ family protein [Candidatus Kapabacteria bacterium]|nr:PorV/PorQ family protein [Candidatus Kapabacteria bacterium]
MKIKNTFSRLTLAIAILSLTTVAASSQIISVTAGDFTKVGLAGGQFLKIGVGARGTGMAGAFSALSNDVTSIFWNPAGLADVKRYAADFSQTFWFGGMTHSFAAIAIPVGEKFRLGASFTGFSSGDINVTTTAQQDGTGGIYNVSDIAIGLTLAGYLTEQFSFGATAKYVQHAFTTMSASGFVFDIGTRYNTGFNGVILGFSINSLGTQQAYDGPDVTRTNPPFKGINTSPLDMQLQTSSFSMPLSFRAGVGVDLCKGAVFEQEVDADGVLQHSWTTAFDFETYSDVPEQFAIGTEYTWKEFVSIRGGYRFGSDQFGLAGGLGIRYNGGGFDGQIDYSINPTKNLGLINRLSIAMRFN